jgi:hypothetical protein
LYGNPVSLSGKLSFARFILDKTHQKKLLNPKIRIQMPVNCTTPARSELNVSMSCGNIGANASGPNPWLKEVAVEIAIALIFQNRLQF